MASADSLLGGLCRESWWLRNRLSRLNADLRCTRHAGLCVRLQQERAVLLARRRELQQLCRQLRASSPGSESLGLALLDDLTSRPIALA